MINEAAPYLHAKIVQCSSQHFEDMGFLDAEDIREDILLGKFDKTSTKMAINHCLSEAVLNLFYEVKCNDCGEVGYILEEGYDSKKTLSNLKSEGWLCSECASRQELTIPVDIKYAIPTKYLGGYEDGDRSKYTNIFKRLWNFLF